MTKLISEQFVIYITRRMNFTSTKSGHRGQKGSRLTAIAEDRLRIRKPTIDQMNSIESTVMSVIFDRYQYLPSPSTFLIKKLRWYTHCFRLKTKSLQGSVDNNSAISWLYDIISLCSQSRNQNFPTNLCFLDSILKQI